MLGEPLIAPLFPAHEDFGPAFVAVLHAFFGVGELFDVPVAADFGVENFVGPVVVLEGGGERVLGGDTDFPFEPFAGSRHEPLFDEVENGVTFDGSELGVESEGPSEVDHDLGPVDAEVDEADFAHHGVARFVPELAGHIAVVVPRFIGGFGDDTGHHFGHIDLADAFVEHHERLGRGRERGIVEEDLGIDPHVVRIGESGVAFWNGIESVGCLRMKPRDQFGSGVLAGVGLSGIFGGETSAIETSGVDEERIQKGNPLVGGIG